MICFDKSISDRKGRSRLFPRLFLLGFLLYGLNAAAQEPDSVLSAKASKSTRQKTSVLASEKQDTVVFRFAPKRRMFWADYKGNAAAINSLTQSIRQHKLSIEYESAYAGFLLLLRFFQDKPCSCEKSKQSGQVLFYRSWGIERGAFSDDEFYATVARNDGCDSRGLCVP